MSTTEIRRTRDAERSKTAILDAAERLFAAHGYQGTSLQDIGDAAGVSRGTPSYFFGSKEGVYRAVLERNFASVGEVIRTTHEEGASRGKAPQEVIARIVEGLIDFLAAHPTFVRLVQWEAVNGGDALAGLAHYMGAVTQSVRSLSDELARGKFRKVDPVQLMLSIAAMCWFPLMQRSTLMQALDIDPVETSFVEDRKRHVVDLVLHGILLD
jgi:TetR/AcrR family transcriptional regulator